MIEHKDNRFVAHFDMLGMATLTKRNPDLAWQKLSELRRANEERLNLVIERTGTNELIANQIKTFTFSDTIIAFSKGNTENDALAIFILTTELFSRTLHDCVPIRGGIAYGRFTFNFDLNLFSGPALVDAYELGESSQWLGIVVDEHTAKTVSKLSIGKSPRGRDVVVPWDMPCKGNVVQKRMVVNWPETQYKNYEGTLPLTIEMFYQPFSELFGSLEKLAPSVVAKYANTVAFFNEYYRT